jgi:hypothetical protein
MHKLILPHYACKTSIAYRSEYNVANMSDITRT